jgi:hybrid cluster-associated redox disulfide protein
MGTPQALPSFLFLVLVLELLLCANAKTPAGFPGMLKPYSDRKEDPMDPDIQPDQNIADLLDRWPQIIPLFMERRMFCVGCQMARFETLVGATAIYGLSLPQFLNEINQTIHGLPGQNPV